MDEGDEEDTISGNGSPTLLQYRTEEQSPKVSTDWRLPVSSRALYVDQRIEENIATISPKKAIGKVMPQQALSNKQAIEASVNKHEIARAGGHYAGMQYASAAVHLLPHRSTRHKDLIKRMTSTDYKNLIESITGEKEEESTAEQIAHGSTVIRKLYNAVRKKDGDDERRIIVPVVLHGETHDALVDTGASHSFINASIVSRYNLKVEQGSGHIELADKSTIQRIGETEHIEVTCGKYTVSAPFEVIEQKYAFAIGMDLFYRFGFSINGLPDPEGSPDAYPEPIPDEKPRIVPIEKPEEELTEEFVAEQEEFMKEIRPLLVLNKAIPL